MKLATKWRVLPVLTGFLGVTAVAGGAGLVSGGLAPEMIQLDGSPFGSYLIPGLVLPGIGIGGVDRALHFPGCATGAGGRGPDHGL